MPNTTLPNIEHATVTFNQWNRVDILMDEGWGFWRKEEYFTIVNGEIGEYYTPAPEEINYFRHGVFSPEYDFTNLVVADLTNVDPSQIFGVDDKVTE